MILAIETATAICSVSFLDSDNQVHEKRITRNGSHSEYLFLFIRELMKEHHFKISDMSSVLISNGPGSYTGLRIGASAVKGILFGLDIPVFAANTMAVFAESAIFNSEKNECIIHAVVNARRNHLYHQKFRFGGMLESVSTTDVKELNEIENLITPGDIIIGSGIERLNEKAVKDCILYGLDKISASALIRLFQRNNNQDFFKETTAEALESNYISSSQINNTNIN